MNQPTPPFDEYQFRQALGRFATGVAIVTTRNDQQEPVGLTISSFNSVSLNPPLVSWCLRLQSRNIRTFKEAEFYNIHILACDQIELAQRFAKAAPAERFKLVDYKLNREGVPLLKPEYCASWFECQTQQQHDAGDHVILIGRVLACQHTSKLPLVFHAGTFDLTPSANIDYGK
ncbi:flavin reductase family protein [Brackiella oedipodis]|uniref:flavin reductase family protein n=1 Tax=Brackiella oedipodis TaxID=124225 RepID=UPI000490E583|nr:flavin reductase family protein [Brackiella oedipodis]